MNKPFQLDLFASEAVANLERRLPSTDWVTVADVATALNYSISEIYTWTDDARVLHFRSKDNGMYKLYRKSVIAFFKARIGYVDKTEKKRRIMICINDRAVNLAGKGILRAQVLHLCGMESESKALIEEARELLYGEVMWSAPGRDQVQSFLNHVILLDLGMLPLDHNATHLGAEMVYFRSSPNSEIGNRPSAILERVA